MLAALRFDAARLREDAPLPALPAGQPPAPPQSPVITAGAARFFDLERSGTATFGVRVAEPAFHTLESTGLLATRGTLRSRYLPALASASGGGTGRNFLVGSYLREGEYQLTVAAQGPSRGHLGVRLRRAALRDGGTLREGSPSRVTVGAAEGVAHEFEIAEAGTYRLEASAAGRPLPCRLEDADGWPIEPPGLPAQFKRRFEPGRYRLLLLPEAVGSRRVTLLERVVDPPRLEGHGPHPLALDATVEHAWVEPPETPSALPTVGNSRCRAPATLHRHAHRRDAGRDPATSRRTGRRTARTHPAGTQLVRPAGRGDLHAHRGLLATKQPRPLRGHDPGRRTRAGHFAHRDGAGDLACLGRGRRALRVLDLRERRRPGRLLDAAGETIAEQQDRPDDWNVQLAARLAPGAYRLELAPTGAENAATRVAMRAIAEREEPPLALPGSREVRPGDDVAVIPLALPDGCRCSSCVLQPPRPSASPSITPSAGAGRPSGANGPNQALEWLSSRRRGGRPPGTGCGSGRSIGAARRCASRPPRCAVALRRARPGPRRVDRRRPGSDPRSRSPSGAGSPRARCGSKRHAVARLGATSIDR